MIKTTARQIHEALQPNMGLNALLSPSVVLPAKASYAVSKLARACSNEMRDFNEERNKLFEKHGCVLGPVAGGKEGEQEWTHAESAKIESAKQEIEELLDVEVEINALPLDLEKFGEARVPANAFYGLDWAIKD